MKFSGLALFILVSVFSESIFAQIERERIESAFIVKFTSFIKGPLAVSKSYNICVWGDEKIYSHLSLDLEQNQYEGGIPFRVIEWGKSFTHADCHVLVTGADLEGIDFTNFKNSIHVTKNKKYFDRSVIYLKQSEGRLKFDVNYKWAQQHNLKVNSKLLQIADYIEK